MAPPRVLIDGYNLALKQGTGIKTYTNLLDQALRSLSVETSFLFGHPLPSTDDALLREVLFYDDNPIRDHSPFGRFRRQAGLWLDAGINKAPEVKRVQDNGVVVLANDTAARPTERALNGSRLFDVAWRRSLTFKRFLDIDLPETFDAVHMTYPLPISTRGAKKVVTVHDLIPLRLPYTTTDDKTEMLRRHRKLCADADLVFTVSEFSKNDIVHLLGVDPAKIEVTYQPSRFAPLRQPEMRERTKTLRRYDLEDKGFVLFIGAIEPKKNLGRLLKAYVEADVDVPLIIAGPRGWMWHDEIGWVLDSKDPVIQKKIRFLNHVSLEDLRFILSGAMALTFPSLYEGYGLPLVEAMGFGVPVLTARSSSLPEVCGDAALYVDPYDVRDIREKIERLVGDPRLRDYLSERGLSRSEQLTPAAFADQVASGYRRLGLLD